MTFSPYAETKCSAAEIFDPKQTQEWGRFSCICKVCTTCFPLGTLANVERLGKSRKRQVFCAGGFPGAPWWFQDPGGPMVGIAGGIVANIPSLGHTKSPAECPSVARIFVRMMVRWDKQTLWVVPPPPWQLCRIIYCGFRLWRCDHSNAVGDNFMVYLVGWNFNDQRVNKLWLIKVLVIKYNYPKGDKTSQTKFENSQVKAKVKTS